MRALSIAIGHDHFLSVLVLPNPQSPWAYSLWENLWVPEPISDPTWTLPNPELYAHKKVFLNTRRFPCPPLQMMTQQNIGLGPWKPALGPNGRCTIYSWTKWPLSGNLLSSGTSTDLLRLRNHLSVWPKNWKVHAQNRIMFSLAQGHLSRTSALGIWSLEYDSSKATDQEMS